MTPIDDAVARSKLVKELAQVANIQRQEILSAFRQVPRHPFVPETEREASYEDRALPLDEDQTISQPSMIAIMLEELQPQPRDRALEVGTGSGYAAALLSRLVGEVHGIEIRPALAEQARLRLHELKMDNVHIHVGDGTLGLPEFAPFKRILVSAGAAWVPSALLEQLAEGGRIVIPVGPDHQQTLMVGEKDAGGHVKWRRSTSCLFVPLVGAVTS